MITANTKITANTQMTMVEIYFGQLIMRTRDFYKMEAYKQTLSRCMFYAIPHFCTITQLSQKSKSARTTCWRAPLNLSSLSNHDPNVPSFFGYIYNNCLASLAASLCESLKYELEKGLRSAYLLPCNGSVFFLQWVFLWPVV